MTEEEQDVLRWGRNSGAINVNAENILAAPTQAGVISLQSTGGTVDGGRARCAAMGRNSGAVNVHSFC